MLLAAWKMCRRSGWWWLHDGCSCCKCCRLTFEHGMQDAGDHNKFMLPGAYSIARLAWLTYQFKEGLENTFFDVRTWRGGTALPLCH